jgi:uncharacterized phage-associated protein
MHDPRAVANRFQDMAGHGLTVRQLHHLVFLAQGWSEAISHSPLVSGAFTASDTGPIHPDLLELGGTGDAIARDRKGKPLHARLSASEEALVERVWKRYGHLHPIELGGLLLQPGTPWANAFFREGALSIVTRASMRAWCTRLALAGRAAAAA